MTTHFSLGTYNIHYTHPNYDENYVTSLMGYSYYGNQIVENWEQRKIVILENLKKTNLDIVCLQEMTFRFARDPIFKKWLSDNDYAFKWQCHRQVDETGQPMSKNDKTLLQHHGVGILFKRHKFTSFSPDNRIFYVINPSTKKILSRDHFKLDLFNEKTQKIIRVISCHLIDPRSLPNKGAHVKAVIEFAEENCSANSIIIAGDMNQDEHGDIHPLENEEDWIRTSQMVGNTAFKEFSKKGYVHDSYVISTEVKRLEIDGTIHCKKRQIDWIWKSGEGELHFLPAIQGFDNSGSDHVLRTSQLVFDK